MQETSAKKMITKEASRRLRPKVVVPNAPVASLDEMLASVLRRQRGQAEKGTYGRMHKRQVKKTVKSLLGSFWVLNSRGTGLIPLTSTPASRNLRYHLESALAFSSYTSPSRTVRSDKNRRHPLELT